MKLDSCGLFAAYYESLFAYGASRATKDNVATLFKLEYIKFG